MSETTPGHIAEWSPRALARTAGAFYLLTLLTGMFAQGFVSGRIIVPGDAEATATNILGHTLLFQMGFAVYMVEMTCNVAFTVFLYYLMRPVSSSLSLLAAALSLVGCGIKTVSRLFYIAPLFILGDVPFMRAFSASQTKALALLLLDVNDQGAAIALVFFGFYALLQGYLVIRSTYLPRALGVLSMLGGLGWLTFLYRPLADRVFPVVLTVGLVGALAKVAWLLVVGVDEQRWRAQAALAAADRR